MRRVLRPPPAACILCPPVVSAACPACVSVSSILCSLPGIVERTATPPPTNSRTGHCYTTARTPDLPYTTGRSIAETKRNETRRDETLNPPAIHTDTAPPRLAVRSRAQHFITNRILPETGKLTLWTLLRRAVALDLVARQLGRLQSHKRSRHRAHWLPTNTARP